MGRKIFKITGIIISILAGIVLVCLVIYTFLYYPRKADVFEINAIDANKKILIATQGSDFKDIFTRTLCDSLKKSSVYIGGIDVRNLDLVNEESWDRIIIINSFVIRLNKDVRQIVADSPTPEKFLVFVTSGGADWQPESDLNVDAITSASRLEYTTDLVNIILDWVWKGEGHRWMPEDKLLALIYFPRVDVREACTGILSEQEVYKTRYPNLVRYLNGIGYQFLRLDDIHSALSVFKLNVNLFPDHWNVYDSYGEGLLLNGDRDIALLNYQKAIELNPNSKSSNDALRKLAR